MTAKIVHLPILLAGPVLRRAEPEQVCIWVACSRPVTIKAEIFRFDDELTIPNISKKNNNDEINNTIPIGLGSSEAIQLGERLYVGLVRVHPILRNKHTNHPTKKLSFPTDVLLAYDIELSYYDNISEGYQIKKIERLRDLGLLSGENSLVYNEADMDKPLPSFFLPGKNTLNIVHGSCRKLHGKGEDCLSIADKLIATSVSDLNKRPSALFLTGDQIYADDVAGPLIQHLTNYGIHLLGWEEKIQGISQELTTIGIGERQRLVREHAKFTSENASNHLLSFGEFASMYLLAWNIENWPSSYPEIGTIPRQMQKVYRKEIEQLERARRVIPAIRRVLANIPTYMIFDDHEITDDWNITREFHEAVCSSNCGKQIMTNGFAAFWAFQAWGNDPSIYNEKFVAKITDYLAKRGNANIEERKEYENFLLDFHGWSFYAPTNPPTIFLDCRTQRGYDSMNGPPILLNDEGLSSLLRLVKGIKYDRNKNYPLIIVSPTPVFGFELAEELQEYLASKSSVYKWDLETWAANENGFVRFLTFLIQVVAAQHCIFISGDVHYGFTVSASFKLFEKKHGKEGPSMSITQLTSSALKTTSFSKGLVVNEILGRLSQVLSSDKSVRVGWNTSNNTELSPTSMQIHRQKGGIIYRIINRILTRHDLGSIIQNTLPSWIEYRNILKPSGFHVPSLVVTDNNIGLVEIAFNNNDEVSYISHQLLVHKGKNLKVHATKVIAR
jgi:hypothetical protein